MLASACKEFESHKDRDMHCIDVVSCLQMRLNETLSV